MRRRRSQPQKETRTIDKKPCGGEKEKLRCPEKYTYIPVLLHHGGRKKNAQYYVGLHKLARLFLSAAAAAAAARLRCPFNVAATTATT